MQTSASFYRLFSFRSFSYEKLLEGITYPWEILDRISSFVDSFALLGKIESSVPQGAFLINQSQIYIGKGVLISPGATIEGPCIIGDGCLIKSNALVRSYTVLDLCSVVGHCSEVKGSLFMPHAKAPHFNYVGDSILGENVNLGAGVKCANLRLDHKPVIAIDSSNARVNTQRKKLGAILGDGCQIGCQTVFNPGVILKKKTLIRPLTSVTTSNISIDYASNNA